ncbi:murein hydrolase activator EnvC family protein [Pelovirga terrestris]|uniref:Peptidoglycan DD-metalloendopeptidase family protein n=1 Tax=Pelovirga terrestris TaxID=2771352 RepID=A0A8J6QW40_9BACT|nr:peptidoglycan DD-metalloendopeptidase family protein [Pelovirga terrestris]MBD1399516.1 peptidoglycan DD-metalloendopeptidase family protein [Pelovirga terrestris]
MVKRTVFCLIIFIFLLSVTVYADNLAQTQHRLEQIRLRIEKAEADIKAQRQTEIDISRDLALLGGQLQRIDERISRIKDEQQRLQRDLGQQQQRLRQSQSQSEKIAKGLEQRLVALYKEGETGMLKILFSADSPSELMQQYHYLTRVMENDRDQLDEFRQAITNQQHQLTQLKQLQQHQSDLLKREEAERQEAVGARRLQARLLQQAQSQNKKLQEEITVLHQDARRLKGLVEQLQKTPPPPSRTVPPVVPGGTLDFAGQRGQLNWPLQGAVLIRFGTQRDDKLGTIYESNGLEISARPNTEVRAVANGQVVYADFFRGYGNLLIVSHEGEYHTLYAQLDRLHKKTGDSVATAELIGHSGLSGRESIYFEIRHKGAPVNPLIWLRPL